MTVPYALYLTEPGDKNAVSVDDINQGELGDCYLLSAIGELALYDPTAITNMIKDDGNGTYTVTLYANSNGEIPYAGATSFTPIQQVVTYSGIASDSVNSLTSEDVVNGQKEIWAQIIEEAYAQANGGYSAIGNGGWPYVAMEELTGQTAQPYSPSAITASILTADRAAGDLITFDTPDSTSLPDGLVEDHAYMYDGLQTIGGATYVDLLNPWGDTEPSPVPISALSTDFDEVDVGKTGAPAVATPATSPLVLTVSENAYDGNAQFTVAVDGVTIEHDGQAEVFNATASHSAGAEQQFNLGNYTAGVQHTVTVDFLNAITGSTTATSRDLYVSSVATNGKTTTENVEMTADGSKNFTAGIDQQIVLHVSEDASNGNAQFMVSVDGHLLEQVYTATASHGAGASQNITLPGYFTSTEPYSIAIEYLNPASGRNLYVNSIAYQSVTAAEYKEITTTTPQYFEIGGTEDPIAIGVSEDAYDGNAEFTVAIDGVTIESGGKAQVFTATTLHSSGKTQNITLPSDYIVGEAHTVSVTFINDANGGTPTTDRNLYVNSISFDGTTTTENTELAGNGTKSFTIGTVQGGSGGSGGSGGAGVSSPASAPTIALAQNATVADAGGNVAYQFATGDGAVTIDNSAAPVAAGTEQVDFLGSVTSDNLWFTKSGSNLVVDVLGTKDQVTLKDFYAASTASAQTTQFDAGSLHLDTQLATLVQAMASFSASHGAFNAQTTSDTSLGGAYFGASLASAAKASWQA